MILHYDGDRQLTSVNGGGVVIYVGSNEKDIICRNRRRPIIVFLPRKLAS